MAFIGKWMNGYDWTDWVLNWPKNPEPDDGVVTTTESDWDRWDGTMIFCDNPDLKPADDCILSVYPDDGKWIPCDNPDLNPATDCWVRPPEPHTTTTTTTTTTIPFGVHNKPLDCVRFIYI